jgi:predicted dehydrogenase
MKGQALSPIRIGVVGAGYIGRVHLPILTSLRDVSVVAICDQNEDMAKSLAGQYGVPRAYPSLNRMLERETLDAVDVLTPPDTHAALAELTLRKGCHCLVEKPLATALSDADSLIMLARKNNLALCVVHNWSFIPGIRKAKSIVDSRALGDIVRIDVKYMTSIIYERYFNPVHWIHRMPGGVFSDISPHLAMLILDFMGRVKVSRVLTKKTSTYSHLGPDVLEVVVESECAIGSFTLSLNTPAYRFPVEIFGTKGCIHVDGDTNLVVQYGPLRGPGDYLSSAAKGMRALSDIRQRVFDLSSNVVHAVPEATHQGTHSHRYLIARFIRNLRGEEAYATVSSRNPSS